MDFDAILDEIGEFGKFQLTNYLLICFPVFFAAANSLSYVFTAGQPNYRCFVPECETLDSSRYNEDWIQHAVPGTINSEIFSPEQCYRFRFENQTTISNDTCPAHWFSSEKERCNQWVYDQNEHTIVEDWDLTCLENRWKLAMVGTMHFAGIVVGSGSFGVLADRYGRKNVFIVAIVFMSITGVGQALSTNYITFLVFAFLNAIGTSGVFPLAFIIGLEMVGKRKREMSGVVLNYFYAIGEAFVGIIAWLNGDWVILQYAVSVPPILFVAYYWIIPESIRWLLAKKENQKAGAIIRKAAAINGVQLSEVILSKFEEQSEHLNEDTESAKISKKQEKKHQNFETWATFKQLIHSKTMMFRAMILFYNWATCALVYYGLSLNSTSLSGNKYLNFILVCLVEIPGYSLAWVLMNNIGRRWSLGGSLLLSGLASVLGGFVPGEMTWLLISLFLIGKLGITSSFAVIYVYTAELSPTIVRSGSVGFMSTVARFGAMVAPFIPLLKIYHDSLPLLIFGGVSLLGGIFALMLPETFGHKLPDTVEEAVKIGSNQDEELSNFSSRRNSR